MSQIPVCADSTARSEAFFQDWLWKDLSRIFLGAKVIIRHSLRKRDETPLLHKSTHPPSGSVRQHSTRERARTDGPTHPARTTNAWYIKTPEIKTGQTTATLLETTVVVDGSTSFAGREDGGGTPPWPTIFTFNVIHRPDWADLTHLESSQGMQLSIAKDHSPTITGSTAQVWYRSMDVYEHAIRSWTYIFCLDSIT